MQTYLPEGIYVTPPDFEEICHKAHTDQIFRAMCIKCDEYHNLYVDLGSTYGIIPRAEVDLGVKDIHQKAYGIISRVGKPVSFQVQSLREDGIPLLSRKAAQKAAARYYLSHLRAGDVIPAVIQNPAEFGVFCDIGCGYSALMRIDRCCISRLTSTAQLYSPGQSIYAAVLDMDSTTGRISLTGREVLGNWEENASRFCSGQTVPGIVRSIMPYGIFIELTPNLSGLAEYQQGLSVGDAVSVHIRSILPHKHKIKLHVLEKLPYAGNVHLPEFYITSGRLSHWEYYPGSHSATLF